MPERGKRHGASDRLGKGPTISDSSSVDKDNPSNIMNKKAGPGKSSDSSSKGPAESSTAARPDTRTLISGTTSWTGKLPVNLLSEHCQRAKWEKPEYSMRKLKDGFISSVTLRKVHTKTKETQLLPPFDLPLSHQHLGIRATSVEARHAAATWALFRVSSMKNIHMMLPPDFRNLWKGEFQNLKTEALKNNGGWLYEADPFLAKTEHDKAEAAKSKQREERAGQREAENGTLAVLGGPPQSTKRSDRHGKGGFRIEMGEGIRSSVESLLRKYAIWNAQNVSVSSNDRQDITQELSSAGFREAHVQEALDYCKDREEALEWLLVHVPEDDLPEWVMPENYVAGVSMASKNISREAMISRLSQAGYAAKICREMLEQNEGKELEAAESLQKVLCQEFTQLVDGSSIFFTEEDEEDAWTQEIETLGSIFGSRFTKISPLICNVKVRMTDIEFSIQFQKSKAYPHTSPILSIPGRSLPAYIKLSIYREAARQASELFLGQPMVYLIVDWIEAKGPRIIANPGRLTDIASAAATIPIADSVGPRAPSFSEPRVEGIMKYESGSAASLSVLKQWNKRQSTDAQHRMMIARRSLPAWKVRGILTDTLAEHQVTIVSGPTGSGKSTQCPQFILDEMIQKKAGELANIICTQPRRISAIGLAHRVSEERCVAVGEEVGYTIRGESKQTQGETRILFCTTGVLLRKLQSPGNLESETTPLDAVTHIIIDEVHERSLDTDFLLILLRDILPSHKNLKLILMSATLDVEKFETYFRPFCPVGKVEIEGRTFPVRDFYLEDVVRLSNYCGYGEFNEIREADVGKVIQQVGTRINYELIAATVNAVHQNLNTQEGSILIFLPGVAEINKSIETLREIRDVYALPLHASLTTAEQRRVFLKAPGSKRKVIAATNVAETSITIPDCVAVIDSGKVKATSFDPERNVVKLEEEWASQAAGKQRRGRAGRVRAGDCYKLYTRNAEAKMALQPEPEIRRVPLEQLCLSIRAMGQADIQGFLSKALTSPEVASVEGAMALLRKIGALEGEKLTALGSHLARLPCDIRCGKLIIYGALFGCLDACLTIASVLTVRSPFLVPQAKRDESKAAKATFLRGHGDLLADMEAYNQWAARRRENTWSNLRAWCDQNFLSHHTLLDISSTRMQYLSYLQEVGFISTESSSASTDVYPDNNTTKLSILRALIAGAFSPQFARIAFPDKKFIASASGATELDPEARTIKYYTQDVGRVFVHPSSTLFDAQSFPGDASFMAYFSKMATSKVFIRDLTPFNAYSLLMFAGDVQLDIIGRGIIVDGWLRLTGWARIGALVGRLRALLDDILRQRLETPKDSNQQAQQVVAVVKSLIEWNGYDR